MKNSLFNRIIKLTLLLLALSSTNTKADEPITTDSRIKTYIYNENDVYKLYIYNGYQSSIEFANDEKVSTVSLGDVYAWKVTPVGRRLFIKPLQDNMHTNMTILTNKRAYQFDLFSKSSTDDIDHDLVYVVRFFYPSMLENENQN